MHYLLEVFLITCYIHTHHYNYVHPLLQHIASLTTSPSAYCTVIPVLNITRDFPFCFMHVYIAVIIAVIIAVFIATHSIAYYKNIPALIGGISYMLTSNLSTTHQALVGLGKQLVKVDLALG